MSGANKVTSHCQFARGPSGPGEGEGGGHQGGAQLGILQQSLLAAVAGLGRSGRGLDTNTASQHCWHLQAWHVMVFTGFLWAAEALGILTTVASK